MKNKFIEFLTEKFSRSELVGKAYKTDKEMINHFLSGEVTIPVTLVNEFLEEQEITSDDMDIDHCIREDKLPSNCQPNQVVKLQFRKEDNPITATVRGVHFYINKVKYDLGLWLGNGSVDNPEYESRIYNVDSIFVTPV